MQIEFKVIIFGIVSCYALGAAAQQVTEIIDFSGDGEGNNLRTAGPVATDVNGNVFIGGVLSDNAFRITPAGDITQIIGPSGDGGGNTLNLVRSRRLHVEFHSDIDHKM